MAFPEYNPPPPETPPPNHQMPRPSDHQIKPKSKFLSFLSQLGNFLYEIIKTAVIILVIALLIRYFLIQPFLVEGQSMEPNFVDNEYLLVQKVTPRFSGYNRGDVVIFRYPKDPKINYIKRIIALPGETISISQSRITIQNSRGSFTLNEPYLISSFFSSEYRMEPIQLGPDEFFVMGDNRNNSSDSREWGPLKKELIIGKAWLVVFPPEKFGIVSRPNYNLLQSAIFFAQIDP